MKLISIAITTLLFSMLFATTPALAGEGTSVSRSAQGLDSAIIASFDEVNMGIARVMMQASAQLATERILAKEKLDADPSNKKLRKEYEDALRNEKKSIQLTKDFILSLK